MSPSGLKNLQPAKNLPLRSSRIKSRKSVANARFHNATATIFSSSVEIDEDCHSGVVRFEFFHKPFTASIFAMPGIEEIFYTVTPSPVGPLLLAASEKGVYQVLFDARPPGTSPGQVWVESRDHLRRCEEQLNAYFCGELREFTLPLDLRGTPFQVRCWEALRRIPYGATCSYAELARQVGSPQAFRAVGQANHNNPVSIIVPCHRVIGANGTLTGYGGGLSVKEKLLQLERGQIHTLFAYTAQTA
jgi:methylated-DNA-[protein]-cysteine S-methyltransferase